MAAPRFRLLASEQVLAALRAETERVQAAGRWGEAEPALGKMREALTHAPLDVGESRAPLPALQLEQRIAMFQPVVVRYAVNEAERVVWLQSVRIRIAT